MLKSRRLFWGQVIGLIGLAFVARVIGLAAQGLWRDEVDALLFATAPWSEVLGNFSRPGWNGPFYFLALRGWVALTGESAFALRYFSLLGGVVSVALIFVLGKRLFGRRVGAIAAILAALSPYWVWYAQEVKMYTWVPALALLALYALDRACEKPQWRWWAVVLVATSFAFYSHILAALLIPVEGLWFLLHPRRSKPAWVGGGVTLALLTLPYLPLLSWQAGLIFQQRQTGYPAYSLGQMITSLGGGWTSGIGALHPESWGIVGAALLVLGLGELLVGGRREVVIQLFAWMAVPLLAIWFVSLRGPIFTDRYLIWTSPAFYLGMASGIVMLERTWKPLAWIFLMVVLTGFLLNLRFQVVQAIKPEYPAAAEYVTARRTENELLLFQIPYNQRVMDYYLTGPVDPVADGPYTNWQLADGSYQVGLDYVDAEMRRITADRTGVWLVYSEVGLWDTRQLVKSWLDNQGTLIDEAHFHLVDLYHYQLKK